MKDTSYDLRPWALHGSSVLCSDYHDVCAYRLQRVLALHCPRDYGPTLLSPGMQAEYRLQGSSIVHTRCAYPEIAMAQAIKQCIWSILAARYVRKGISIGRACSLNKETPISIPLCLWSCTLPDRWMICHLCICISVFFAARLRLF